MSLCDRCVHLQRAPDGPGRCAVDAPAFRHRVAGGNVERCAYFRAESGFQTVAEGARQRPPRS
jgi:hypothetical protein